MTINLNDWSDTYYDYINYEEAADTYACKDKVTHKAPAMSERVTLTVINPRLLAEAN